MKSLAELTEEPPRAFLVMKKYDWSKEQTVYTDDPKEVTKFLSRKCLDDYILDIYNRPYNWCKNTEPTAEELESHLKLCLDLDTTFYPPDQFPRYHWWE